MNITKSLASKYHLENHFRWLRATDKSPAESGQRLHLPLVNRVQEQQPEIQKGLQGRRCRHGLVTWKRRIKRWQGGPRSCPGDTRYPVNQSRGCAQWCMIRAHRYINNSREEVQWAQKGGMARDSHFVTMIHRMGAWGVIQSQLLASETNLVFLPWLNQPWRRRCLIMLPNS